MTKAETKGLLIGRKELLEAVEAVKPAIAGKEVIEACVHVFSDGEQLTAYNDNLAIQAPLASKLKGGIRGTILLGILANSRAKEVEIIVQAGGDGQEAEIKAGRTRLKLSLLPQDRDVFKPPSLGKGEGIGLSGAFLEALKQVLVSAGNGIDPPEQQGVTIIGDATQVHLFTTQDDKTVAWKSIERPKAWKEDLRITLPTFFVEQLIRLGDDKTKLFLSKEYAHALTGKGIKIYSKIVHVPKPIDFAKIATAAMKETDPVAIPSRLRLALERASVMLNGQNDEFMEITVKGDRLGIYAKCPHGELDDSMIMDKPLPPIECKLHPDLLKRALEHCTKIGFAKSSIVMTGERFVYLAATAAL